MQEPRYRFLISTPPPPCPQKYMFSSPAIRYVNIYSLHNLLPLWPLFILIVLFKLLVSLFLSLIFFFEIFSFVFPRLIFFGQVTFADIVRYTQYHQVRPYSNVTLSSESNSRTKKCRVLFSLILYLPHSLVFMSHSAHPY